MARWAILNTKDNRVLNVTEWDGVSSWTPPEGTTLRQLTDEESVGKGWRWLNEQWVWDPSPEWVEIEWTSVRNRRTELLAASDYKLLPDVWAEMSGEEQEKWTAYRKALRNITKQTDPFNLVWPVSPDEEIG